MGIMHTFPSEILSEILQKIKLPSIKRIMKQSRSIKNQILDDYFLWKSKCNPGETSLDTKKVLERVKKDTLIATALVKHRMKPKIIVTYQTDITMIKTSSQFVITSSDDSSIKAYSLTSMNSKKFLGHKGGVWDFSFNNKFLASSSIDKTVKLWNFETGKCVLTLNGHTATVRTVKLVEDRIISGGRDGSIRIWDYYGNCIFVLENHKASVRCLDIFEDELLSGSYDGSVLLWNWKTGKLIKKLSSHESRVYAVLICNDFYISSGQDCLINVYSKITKNSVKYKLHKSIISNLSLCYFENKPFLISAGLDGIIGIWDIYKNQLHTKILEAPGLIHVKSFNKYLVVGLNNSVKVYNAKTGKYVRTLLEDLQTVHFIEFTDNVLAVGFRSNSKCAVYVINFNEYIEAMYHRKDSYKVKEAMSKLIKF